MIFAFDYRWFHEIVESIRKRVLITDTTIRNKTKQISQEEFPVRLIIRVLNKVKIIKIIASFNNFSRYSATRSEKSVWKVENQRNPAIKQDPKGERLVEWE